MEIKDFSFKKFEEEYNQLTDKIVFVVSGVFMGEPFKEVLIKKNSPEGYSKNGILGEVAEIVRKKYAEKNGPQESEFLDDIEKAKVITDTAQRLVDVLNLDDSVGYLVVTLRCKHKYAKGDHVECPMCGEIV